MMLLLSLGYDTMHSYSTKVDLLTRSGPVAAPLVRYPLFNISSTQSNPNSMSFPLWGRPVWGSTPMIS